MARIVSDKALCEAPDNGRRLISWHHIFPPRRDALAMRSIWVALVLSLLVHLFVLWEWLPRLRPLALDSLAKGDAEPALAIRLTPPPTAPAVPAPEPPRVEPPRVEPRPPPKAPPPSVAKPRPPRVIARARPPAPPVITAEPPVPSIPVPPPEPPAAAEPSPPPKPTTPAPAPEGDLSSYIASRRRARGETDAPARAAANPAAEDDIARRDRIVASNLASINSQTFGEVPRNSGGIFSITRLGYRDAEFTFFGWNKDIGRRASQRIEVQQGANADIRIAVVRRMIAIVREYEQEDFSWESRRLGRIVTLSARAADNAGLEEFMMREFFDASGAPR